MNKVFIQVNGGDCKGDYVVVSKAGVVSMHNPLANRQSLHHQALLATCNHTILTHGTFGHWASYLNGGEFYSEYGAIVPDPYT